MISIHVQNTFIELGKTDLDIRCLVNDSELASITVIQLRRSNTNIVSIRETGVAWQDEILQRRAVANASVINVPSSYLHMAIERQNVTTNDSGTYFCIMSAKYRNNAITSKETGKIFLNITGNQFFQL